MTKKKISLCALCILNFDGNITPTPVKSIYFSLFFPSVRYGDDDFELEAINSMARNGLTTKFPMQRRATWLTLKMSTIGTI